MTRTTSTLGLPAWLWSVVQALWFISGIVGAALHTLHTVPSGAPDGITLSFLLFAFAAFLIPILKNINLPGGGSIELIQDQVVSENSKISQALTLAITDMASLMRYLTDAENRLQSVFQLTNITGAGAYAFAIETCQTACFEASRWLVPTIDEGVRVTLWWFDPMANALMFIYTTASNSDDLAKVEFTVDDHDYIGDAYRNSRLGNYSDAPDELRAPSPPGAPYRGLLFVPVVFGGRTVGIIEVDRAHQERFDRNAEIVASALANFSGFVMTHPRVQLPFQK